MVVIVVRVVVVNGAAALTIVTVIPSCVGGVAVDVVVSTSYVFSILPMAFVPWRHHLRCVQEGEWGWGGVCRI